MKKRILSLFPLVLLMVSILCVPALALEESDVQAAISESSKEAVTGNVLIWFLCAVAFLKVSQKMDSFLASLGVNVGRTGGSLMAEAMIAARGVSMLVRSGGGAIGGIGRAVGGASSGSAGSPGSTGGFFKGGIIGMAGRHITNSAVKSATTQTAAVHTAQKQSATSATHTASTVHTGGADTTVHSAEHTGSEVQTNSATATMAQQEGVIITGQETQAAVHTDRSTQVNSPGKHVHTQGGGAGTASNQGNAPQTSHSSTHTFRQTSIGGAVFARSLASGGRFANDVIGTVARGDIRSGGSITGDLAAQSLSSYMGHTALGSQDIPRYSDVEIGGGRITGTEIFAGCQEGLAFGMYHAGQFAAPEGPHQKVFAADGTMWFKQYAQDAVERKPYQAPDGSVAYEEKIVKKLPNAPKRKGRI